MFFPHCITPTLTAVRRSLKPLQRSTKSQQKKTSWKNNSLSIPWYLNYWVTSSNKSSSPGAHYHANAFLPKFVSTCKSIIYIVRSVWRRILKIVTFLPVPWCPWPVDSQSIVVKASALKSITPSWGGSDPAAGLALVLLCGTYVIGLIRVSGTLVGLEEGFFRQLQDQWWLSGTVMFHV